MKVQCGIESTACPNSPIGLPPLASVPPLLPLPAKERAAEGNGCRRAEDPVLQLGRSLLTNGQTLGAALEDGVGVPVLFACFLIGIIGGDTRLEDLPRLVRGLIPSPRSLHNKSPKQRENGPIFDDANCSLEVAILGLREARVSFMRKQSFFRVHSPSTGKVGHLEPVRNFSSSFM